MSSEAQAFAQVKARIGIMTIGLYNSYCSISQLEYSWAEYSQIYGTPAFIYKGSIDPTCYLCLLFVL
jgi:hypothetical protein